MKKEVLVNLSIDDVHPETSKHIADCGGDRERGGFRFLLELLKEFPGIKITLFVTPNWIDKPDNCPLIKTIKRILKIPYSNAWKNEPFRLDKHRDWCAWLKELCARYNFEIGIHGFYHHNPDSYKAFHSMEFIGLSRDEVRKRITLAEKILLSVGLKFERVFRPPGWGVTDELFEVLREYNYILSCKSLNVVPEVVRGIVNIPPNWNIGHDSLTKGVLLAKRYGVLTMYGHIEDKYGREFLGDGLNERTLYRIRALLHELMRRFKVKFVSLKELAEEWLSIAR